MVNKHYDVPILCNGCEDGLADACGNPTVITWGGCMSETECGDCCGKTGCRPATDNEIAAARLRGEAP